MGWIAIYKDGKIEREEDNVGRPVQAGQDGLLRVVAQEDFGHRIAVDLINGVFAFDYDMPISVQNGTVELSNPKLFLWALHGETNIIGELVHWKTEFDPKIDSDTNKPVLDESGKVVLVKTDFLTPLTWRPIWFTRMTNGIPAKVIGAQTTLPDTQGGGNIKRIFTIFSDGRVGIDYNSRKKGSIQ